jgi:hypothetical protein
MQKLDGDLLIVMSKRAKLKILAVLFLQYSATVFTFVALRMIKLLDFVMGKLAILIVAPNCTFYV